MLLLPVHLKDITSVAYLVPLYCLLYCIHHRYRDPESDACVYRYAVKIFSPRALRSVYIMSLSLSYVILQVLLWGLP